MKLHTAVVGLLAAWSCAGAPGTFVVANRGLGVHEATCEAWLRDRPAGVRWHLTACDLDFAEAYEVRGLLGAGALKEAYVQVRGGQGPALFVGVDSEASMRRLRGGGERQDLDVILVEWDLTRSKEAQKLASTVKREQHRELVVAYVSGGAQSWAVSTIALALFPWVLWALGAAAVRRMSEGGAKTAKPPPGPPAA